MIPRSSSGWVNAEATCCRYLLPLLTANPVVTFIAIPALYSCLFLVTCYLHPCFFYSLLLLWLLTAILSRGPGSWHPAGPSHGFLSYSCLYGPSVSLLMFMMWPPVCVVLEPCVIDPSSQYWTPSIHSWWAPLTPLHHRLFFASMRILLFSLAKSTSIGVPAGIFIKIVLSKCSLSGPPVAALHRILAGLLTTIFG